MERLNQFDVVEVQGSLAVIIESTLLAPEKTMVTIPLIENYPRVRLLNPVVTIEGVTYTLATRLMAAIPKSHAKSTGHSLATNKDEIIRSVDVLISGV